MDPVPGPSRPLINNMCLKDEAVFTALLICTPAVVVAQELALQPTGSDFKALELLWLRNLTARINTSVLDVGGATTAKN